MAWVKRVRKVCRASSSESDVKSEKWRRKQETVTCKWCVDLKTSTSCTMLQLTNATATVIHRTVTPFILLDEGPDSEYKAGNKIGFSTPYKSNHVCTHASTTNHRWKSSALIKVLYLSLDLTYLYSTWLVSSLDSYLSSTAIQRGKKTNFFTELDSTRRAYKIGRFVIKGATEQHKYSRNSLLIGRKLIGS